MKRIILVFTYLLFGFSVFAQNVDTVQKSIKLTLGRSSDLRKSSSKALIVINDRPFLDQQILSLVNKNDVIDISVLNGTSGEEKFGISGKYGVLQIIVKPKLKFINLEQLLTKFKINQKNKMLGVYVNNEKILFRGDFFVADKWVKKVKVMHSPNSIIKDVNYIILSK